MAAVMYLKCVLFVFLLALVAPFKFHYAGDTCFDDQSKGICKLLQQCPPLMVEIQKAGSPMPSHMRKKLQHLMCGFEFDDPVVCCVEEFIIDPNDIRNRNLSLATTTTNESKIPNELENGSDINKSGEPNVDPGRQSPYQNHPNLNLLPMNCGSSESDRIYGGTKARLFEMPWMALIAYTSRRERKLSCAGTLISEYYVLTAAHCVAFLGTRLTLSNVILGEYNIITNPDCETVDINAITCAPNVTEAGIDYVIPHPGYSPQNMIDDIALIRLSQPADFSLDSIKPICLPLTIEQQQESLEGVNATVAGWGSTEDGLASSVLLTVDVPILNNKACETAYRLSMSDKQICAGGVVDKDSCAGDSGGPLVYPGKTAVGGVRVVQRGVVSYGSKRCGIGGYPGVYTRVSSYVKWILDNIRE